MFLEKDKELAHKAFHHPSVNWERVQSLAVYHRIRPVIYEAARQLNFSNPTIRKFEEYSKEQALLNLLYLRELENVLSYLKEKQIAAIPYKGLLFLHTIFHNRSVRESGDLDIVVSKENAVATIQALLSSGFVLKLDLEPQEDLFRQLVESAQGRQVSLVKLLPSGNPVHIDLHWGVNEEYHRYLITTDDFFRHASAGVFSRNEILIPGREAIFAMILNHNGGRECWTRLKDIVDLLAFEQTYQVSPDTLNVIASGFQMKKIYLSGRALIEAYFNDNSSSLPFEEGKIVKMIGRYWDGASREWIFPKLRFVFIYRALQDKNHSLREMVALFYSHFSSKYFHTDFYGYPFSGQYQLINKLTRWIRKKILADNS